MKRGRRESPPFRGRRRAGWGVGRRARRGRERLAGDFRGLVIRAGEGCCRPRSFSAVRVAVHSECSIDSCFPPVRGWHSRCCRRSLAESSTRHISRGRRPTKVLSARVATGRAPVRGSSRLLLGDGFGQASNLTWATKETNDAQRIGEAPRMRQGPGGRLPGCSLQIADPGDGAHPRLEMPSPLALFGGLVSRPSGWHTYDRERTQSLGKGRIP